ncbi:MAG: hypothetical protein FWG11_07555, partial [Promicromonosporaceae bacterium]|nr:hypothetical protein [Promicromonosporaceae bacterium]
DPAMTAAQPSVPAGGSTTVTGTGFTPGAGGPAGATAPPRTTTPGRRGGDPWGMAVRVNTGGTFNMHGGTVSDHQAFGGGGAFLLEGGTVNMYQGYVRNNHARAGGGASAVTNGDHEGGAFLVQSGTLNISGGAIYNNTARHGGAIHVRGGEVNIFEQDDLDHFVGPVFTNNHARVSGGAIGQSFVATGGNAHTGGTVNIGGGWLTTNTAAVSGGGIWSLQGPTRTGALNLSGGLLRDNSAVRGGGAFLQGGTSTFTGGRFEENQAGHAGGGIYLHAATLHVTGVTFDGNSAVNGGGVKVSQSSTLHATDSSFVDNRANLATGRGGAIHLGANPHLHLAGTEVLGNWAALGGGIGMSAEDYERITISHDPLAAPTVFNHNLAEGSRWYLREDLVPIHQANITIPLGQGMFSARTVGTPSGFFNHAYNNYDIQYPALPEPPAPELTVLHSSDYDVSRTDHRTRAEVPGTHPSGDSGEHEVTLTITNSGNTTLVDLDFTQEPGSDAFYTAWVCGQDDEPIAAFLTGLILFPGESVVCTATINHVPADGSHLSLVRVDAQTPQLIVEDTTVVLSATAADEWEAFVDEPLFDPPTDWMSLPFTGGCGPLPWTLAGLAGAAVLGALFYQRRRRPTGEAA